MTTTSRGISKQLNHSRASSTPGKTKGAFCVRRSDSGVGCNINPYKGQGLKGQNKAQYNRFWDVMLPVNGVRR